MSPLLERLGSDPGLTGLIACAGPVTGVLVQPIVGSMSDQCKSKLGRRRPFLLVGAILTAVSLFLMPNSPNLMMAAILLWVLDASLNITQGPYRALVPDIVHKKQQATAYSLMSLTIGLGSVIAFWIGSQIASMHQLFYLGGSAILLAMIWTIITSPEQAYRPEKNLEPHLDSANASQQDNFFTATVNSIRTMPTEAKKLCLAHSFTWFGLACLFIYFSLYVPHQIFGALTDKSPHYQEGVQWASLCYAVMNGVCFLGSALITRLCVMGLSKKLIHTVGLLCMAASLIGMNFITTPEQVMIAMGLLGVGWATTLSIPFALLSDHVPPGKEGVLMGTFNVFIAAPQVITSLVVGQLIVHLGGGNVTMALVIGGGAMLISALLLQFVKEETPHHA
ncbi:MAG: MFS transporter, partial [Cyanobacteria bacterium]|nr:MFS transporter [Cyanobacteriota bacterium]